MTQKYFFRNFFLEDGLPQATVLCVYQDKKGHIWIGTQGGVSKYNGRTFENFDTRHGLSGNHIFSIFQDSKHRVWFGHRYEGITMLKNRKFYKIPLTETLSNNLITHILEDDYGNIWASTLDHGIYVLEETTDTSFNYTNLSKETGFLNNHVSDMVKKGSEIYACTDTGLVKYNTAKYLRDITSEISVHNNELGSFIQSSALDSNGNIWLNLNSDLVKIIETNNNYEVQKFPYEKEIDIVYLDRIAIDQENNIWGTSYNGIYEFDGNSFKIYNKKNGFAEKDANSIIVDRENNIWIGGMNKGVFKFSGDNFMFYDKDNGLINNLVTAITEDSDNNMWLGTEEGLSLFDGEKYRQIKITEKLNSNSISALFTDSKGNIWISTYAKATILRFNSSDNSFTTFNKKDGIIDYILSISEDKNGNIWFASLGYGALRYTYPTNNKKREFKLFTKKEGLCSDFLWIVHADKNKTLWFGSDDAGISKLINDSSFISLKKKDGLSDLRAAAITHDMHNNLWIATIGGGIFKYDGKTFKNYGLKEGLSSDSPFCIICDNNNTIWVGTNSGIDKLDSITGRFIHYGKEDGFLGIETNQNAVYKDHKGKIWFGTVNGAIKVSPDEFDINQRTPTLILDKIQLFFEDFDYEAYSDSLNPMNGLPVGLKLPYKKNHLSFYFSALSYVAPEKVKYRFMLENFDKDWSPISDMTKAVYTNIPPGNYTFKFKASNNDGFWNKEPYEFHFTITPPFYKTVWFYIICIIIVIIIFNILIYYRTRRLNKSKLVLKRKVELRTNEIMTQKEEIESQRDALKVLNDELKGQQAQIIEKNEELKQQKEEILTQRDEIEKKSLILQKVNKIVESKNKNITDSIKYAKKIQDAILPDTDYLNQLLEEYFIYYQPKDIVSGDFYWIQEKHGLIYAAVVDCTGHGVPGAFMSIIAYNLLNQALNEHRYKKPSEILNFISKNLKITLHQTDEDSIVKAGLTITLCAIDKTNFKLTYASAQNSFLLLRNGKVTHYKGQHYPIGFTNQDFKTYNDYNLDLEENDHLYIFSDGYTDQFGGDKNRKLMYKGLKQKLIELETLSFEQQKNLLKEHFMLWKGDNDQIDDVLLIGIKI